MASIETVIEIFKKDKTKYDLVDLAALVEFIAEYKSRNAIDGLRCLLMALIAYSDEKIGLDKESVLKLINESWDSKKEYDKEENERHGH